MLKKAGSVVFFLIVALALSGQNKIHIKAGITLASLQDKFDPQKQARLGVYAGFSGEIPISTNLHLQPELLYSLRGYRFPATQFNSAGTVAQNYVTVPFLLGYSATKKLKLVIGPEPGYLISATSRFDGNSHNVTRNISYRFNLDASGGINYEFTEGFEVETRFSFGVTPQYKGIITDNLGNITGVARTGFHRVLQVGVKYELKK